MAFCASAGSESLSKECLDGPFAPWITKKSHLLSSLSRVRLVVTSAFLLSRVAGWAAVGAPCRVPTVPSYAHLCPTPHRARRGSGGPRVTPCVASDPGRHGLAAVYTQGLGGVAGVHWSGLSQPECESRICSEWVGCTHSICTGGGALRWTRRAGPQGTRSAGARPAGCLRWAHHIMRERGS